MEVGVLRYQSARTKVLELDVWKPAEVVVPWHVISSRVVFVFSGQLQLLFGGCSGSSMDAVLQGLFGGCSGASVDAVALRRNACLDVVIVWHVPLVGIVWFVGVGEVLKSPPTAMRAKLRSLVAIFTYGH